MGSFNRLKPLVVGSGHPGDSLIVVREDGQLYYDIANKLLYVGIQEGTTNWQSTASKIKNMHDISLEENGLLYYDASTGLIQSKLINIHRYINAEEQLLNTGTLTLVGQLSLPAGYYDLRVGVNMKCSRYRSLNYEIRLGTDLQLASGLYSTVNYQSISWSDFVPLSVPTSLMLYVSGYGVSVRDLKMLAKEMY